MADYLSLEEAATKLGISSDRLVDLRSQGQVRGFRDGTSWKFPENAIDQLAEDLAAGGGSDLGIGGESLIPGSGSDVNLVPSEGDGSDVEIVANDSDFMMESEGDDLLEIDSSDLSLNDVAISHDSAQLDLAMEPNAGSTGPVTDEELREISESHPDVLPPDGEKTGGGSSLLDIGGDEDSDDIKLESESDLSFSTGPEDHDSGEELIGDDGDSSMEVLGSGLEQGGSGSQLTGAGASNLEMMGDLDDPGDAASKSGRGADVLSELDLLGGDQQGSGLISGDSENLLASSGLGSSIGADALRDSDLGGLDDALAGDDELVIADDDDDLVLGSAGSDISVAGDSGINLMSPSDSGLSLESEPLDLAGSSISALDLGAELSDGGSSGSGRRPGSGSGAGSGVDFDADEEFQLSPSGVGLDADIESGSQVIEVEDSEALGEPVEFAEAEPLGDAFAADADAGDALALDDDGEAIAIDDTASTSAISPATMGGYEVPFTMLQCVTLMMIVCVLGVGGMLLTDLVRNMWAYNATTAPVSSLTNSLIDMMGW